MERIRQASLLLSRQSVLLCALVLCGCSATPPVVGQGSPAAVPYVPTEQRPIVPAVGDVSSLLIFGGDDGQGRFILRKPEGLAGYGIGPDGCLAAVMTDDGIVRFYDKFGESIARIPLPQYTPPRTDEQQSARLFVGEDGQAIVSLVRHKRLPRQDHVVRPYQPVPVHYMTWHVKADGESQVLDHELVLAAMFLDKGRVAIIDGPDVAAPSAPHDRWRLTWYDRPSKRAWQASFPDRPWLAPEESSDGITVRLPGHWPLLFSAEGKWAVHPPDTEALREQNPGYVSRAGAYYEKEYLPSALANLSQALDLNARQRGAAGEALKQFIHDWLVMDVEDGFLILPEHQDRCLTDLDERMRHALSPAQFDAWPTWRESNHALRFLMIDRADPRVAPKFSLQRFP